MKVKRRKILALLASIPFALAWLKKRIFNNSRAEHTLIYGEPPGAEARFYRKKRN